MDKASYKSNNPFIDRLLDEIRDGIAAKVAAIEAQADRLEIAIARFEAAAETIARAAAVFEVAAQRLTPEPVTLAAKSSPGWLGRLIGKT